MTSLYLIRHGEAFANVTHVVGGMRGDTGLTPLGVLQAQRLRDRLKATGEIRADVLIASTLPRARQTAEIIAPAFGLPLTLDDEVHELRPGEADGMDLTDAVARYAIPDIERDPFRPVSPGGESFAQFMLRVASALDRITREHAGQTIVVVTHGGVIDGSFLHFFKAHSHSAPHAHFGTTHTSLTLWQRRRRWNQTVAWHLIYYNDSTHLRDIEAAHRIPWSEISTAPRGGPDDPAQSGKG